MTPELQQVYEKLTPMESIVFECLSDGELHSVTELINLMYPDKCASRCNLTAILTLVRRKIDHADLEIVCQSMGYYGSKFRMVRRLHPKHSSGS